MEDIKRTVNSLINKYGTNCPFKIASTLGIQVQYEYLGNILGYYSKHFRIPIIHINELAQERQKIFICSHELGHAILHPDVNASFLKRHTLFSTDRIEVEANTFAIELLFSDSQMDCVTIYEALEDYGMPKQLAQLKSLG